MFKLRLLLNGAETATIELESGRSYTAGRSSSCGIQLGDFPGISRQHFRVYEQYDQWMLEVVSKLGAVYSGGASVTEMSLTDGASFKVGPYDFYFELAESSTQHLKQAAGQESDFVAAANPPAVVNHVPQAHNQHDDDHSGYESTVVAQVVSIPYIRIVKDSEGTEETLRLEGTLWLAGREDSCDITLDDVKSSRRHFELSVVGGEYFIRDLGSSNGTLLNGSRLKTDELTPIKSGDVIGVGTTTLHFEVRDPNFRNKLTVLPQQLTALPPGAEFANVLPFPGQQGGVVHLDANGLPVSKKKTFDFSNPRTRIFATVAAVLLIIAAIFGGGDESAKPTTPTSADTKKIAFEKLPEPQKKLVRDSYQLAYNLYLGQKWQLADQQIDKIHMILPEGYEESFKLKEEIKQFEENRLRRIAIEDEQRRLEENRRKVEASITNCQPVARSSSSVARVQECLAEALTLDPENTRIQNMIAEVENRLETERIRAQNKADYARSIGRTRRLAAKAEKLEASGDLLGAIKAWESVLNSGADPGGLKDKARERLTAIKSGLDKEVEKRINAAEGYYANGKNKDAFNELKKASSLSPNNSRVAELMERFTRELNSQLQTIYADSVLEEGLGDMPSAKEKWRKILELDRPEGEYYRRAQSKLRQYGSAK